MHPALKAERDRREAALADQVGKPGAFMARYASIRSGGLYSVNPVPRRTVPAATERAQTRITVPDIFINFNHPLDRHTVVEVQKAFCRVFPIKMEDLKSSVRRQPIVGWRQMCMGLAKKLTKKSLPELGRLFGGRDHTTVLHATRVADPILQSITLGEDATIDEWVLAIREALSED